MDTKLENNADLYSAVLAQLKNRKSSSRTLEGYLLRLLELVGEEAQERPILPARFAQILDAAFEGTPRAISLETLTARAADEVLPAWQRTLARQIADLKEMDRAGTLDDEYRFFGIDAPTGSRWYNFDPVGFIECGMAGSIGGWDPSSNADRSYVPGPVAYIDEEGKIATAEPEALQQDPVAIPHITWDDFEDFLWCGQNYE